MWTDYTQSQTKRTNDQQIRIMYSYFAQKADESECSIFFNQFEYQSIRSICFEIVPTFPKIFHFSSSLIIVIRLSLNICSVCSKKTLEKNLILTLLQKLGKIKTTLPKTKFRNESIYSKTKQVGIEMTGGKWRGEMKKHDIFSSLLV